MLRVIRHLHLSSHPAVVPGSLEAERVFEVGLVDGAGYGRVVVVVVGNIEQPHVSLVLWPGIENNFMRFYQLKPTRVILLTSLGGLDTSKITKRGRSDFSLPSSQCHSYP